MRKKMSIMVAMLTVLMMSTTVFAETEVTQPVVDEDGEGRTGGTGSSELQIDVEATEFSVTVPAALPISVAQDGKTTGTAEGAAIINNSMAPVEITGAEIVTEGWDIVAFGKPMKDVKIGTQELGFDLNGIKTTDKNGNLTIPEKDKNIIGDGGTYGIDYDVTVAPQLEAISASDDSFAKIVFTLNWANN